MLVVLADGSKLPPSASIPGQITLRCQTTSWMTNYHMKKWLAVVWNIRPGVLHRKWGMLVFDIFKGHLTPEMKATIVP
jgi:DDE superfamily endonuclease.